MATFWASLENVTFKKKTFDYRLDNFCKKGYFLFQHLVTLRLTLSRSHEWHHFWKDSQWPNWHYGQAVQANKQSRCQWLNCRHHLRRNLKNLWLVQFLNFFRRSLGIGFKPTPSPANYRPSNAFNLFNTKSQTSVISVPSSGTDCSFLGRWELLVQPHKKFWLAKVRPYCLPTCIMRQRPVWGNHWSEGRKGLIHRSIETTLLRRAFAVAQLTGYDGAKLSVQSAATFIEPLFALNCFKKRWMNEEKWAVYGTFNQSTTFV